MVYLELVCHNQDVIQLCNFFFRSGVTVYACSKGFVYKHLQKKRAKIWVLNNHISSLILVSHHSLLQNLNIQKCTPVKKVPGHKIDLSQHIHTFSDLLEYLRNSRFKGRFSSVTAVSPHFPGVKHFCYVQNMIS